MTRIRRPRRSASRPASGWTRRAVGLAAAIAMPTPTLPVPERPLREERQHGKQHPDRERHAEDREHRERERPRQHAVRLHRSIQADPRAPSRLIEHACDGASEIGDRSPLRGPTRGGLGGALLVCRCSPFSRSSAATKAGSSSACRGGSGSSWRCRGFSSASTSGSVRGGVGHRRDSEGLRSSCSP